MKFVTFTNSGERFVGSVNAEEQRISVFDLSPDEAHQGLLCMIGRIAEDMPAIKEVIQLNSVVLDAPIPKPIRNIFCVGKNYHAHAKEFYASGFDSSSAAGIVSEYPIVFSKVPETVVATKSLVMLDSKVSSAIDYEAELGVIIGKQGRATSIQDTMDLVWGYTIINDVTARDLQKKHSQWIIGKSQDTFCPMGPWAVTKDELDLATAGIRGFVNGEKRQEARFSQLIFDVPTIISSISAGITLYPGDIIATGTPAGVGIGFDPPKYLQSGDVVRIEIDGLGVLENQFLEREN